MERGSVLWDYRLRGRSLPQATRLTQRTSVHLCAHQRGLINGLANPALDAEPHHANLITRKRETDPSISPALLSMHQNEAALKWMTNLDYVHQKKKKKEEEEEREAGAKEKAQESKAACHE